MGRIEITTNNVPRPVHDDWNKEGEQNDPYVIYKGEIYLLEDFQSTSAMGTIHKDFREAGWDGYISDTFFSGILLRWVPGTDWEEVVMGRYFVSSSHDS